MHLRYCLIDAMGHNENRHPQKVMKDMGITYQHATPQSIADQWWFWNCDNIPEKLPSFITELEIDPISAIGYGLSKEDAEEIKSKTDSNHNNNQRP
jgi:hypothetical protein